MVSGVIGRAQGGVDQVGDKEDDRPEQEPAGQQHQHGVHLAAHHLVHHTNEVIHRLCSVLCHLQIVIRGGL